MLGGMNEENERHRSAAHLLYKLAKPLRVLSALGWEGRLREEFLARAVRSCPSRATSGSMRSR